MSNTNNSPIKENDPGKKSHPLLKSYLFSLITNFLLSAIVLFVLPYVIKLGMAVGGNRAVKRSYKKKSNSN